MQILVDIKKFVTGVSAFLAKFSAPAQRARFADNGDGTVTDIRSGLTWLKRSYSPGSTVWNWNQAFEYCQNLSVAGSRGWRLPTRAELSDLDLPHYHDYVGGDPLEHMLRRKARSVGYAGYGKVPLTAVTPLFHLDSRAVWTSDKQLVDVVNGKLLRNDGRNGPVAVLPVRGS